MHFDWNLTLFNFTAILLQRPTPGVTGPESWFWTTTKESDGAGVS